MGYEQAIDKLERDLRTLRLEFERFFAGATRVPPEDLQVRLSKDLRGLRNSNITSTADNFRLAALEAQFNAYNELNGRRLREREEGRSQTGEFHLVVPRPAYDAASGITLGERPDSAALEALFAGLYRASAQAGKVDLESFRNYIQGQIANIRQKTGCAEVQFRVAVEDGKPRLKARPIAGR